MTLAVPPLAPGGTLRVPEWAERTLPNGLTVIAVRRAAVPLVELRLRIPFGLAPVTESRLLARTLFSGTATLSNVDIDSRLQAIGGSLGASCDADRLLVSGGSLVSGLPELLRLLGEVLTGADYPESQLAVERDRLADRIVMARRQPSHLAREALRRRLFPDHPYEVQTPEPEEVRAARRDALRQLHEQRVHARGATLVLVGDMDLEQALDLAEAALGGWSGGGEPVVLPPVPPLEPGPLTVVDRPGSVQASLRLALPAVGRTHPDHPYLQLATLIFGGYFSSRLTENIREDKGYTYSPNAGVEHNLAGSVVVVGVESATEVVAPVLVETTYELGRLAVLPPTEEELTQARQYVLGGLQIALATQSDLASLVSAYAGFGLRLDHLARYAEALSTATVEQVAAAAGTYLRPSRLAGIVVGDASRLEPELSKLVPVVREAGPRVDRDAEVVAPVTEPVGPGPVEETATGGPAGESPAATGGAAGEGPAAGPERGDPPR